MNRLLLVSALLAVTLTACGKKEQASVPPATPPAPAADAGKPADGAAAGTSATEAAATAAPAMPEKKAEQKN